MSRKKIPHFRFYPTDFLDGTKGMSAAVVGDYIRVLCAIYDQDGRLPNEPYSLRHLFNVPRASDAIKVVERLIWFGKLWIDTDGYLRNGRADHEIEKRHEFQTKNPAAKGAANPAVKGAAGTPKKPMKTMGVGTPARAFSSSYNNNLTKLAPSFHPRETTNGSAPAAAGSLGLEGRSPQPPTAKGRAPSPDKPWPPVSLLKQRLIEQGLHHPNGKAAAKHPKPSNGAQPGRHRSRPRPGAKLGRTAEDKPGAQKGAEAESKNPIRS